MKDLLVSYILEHCADTVKREKEIQREWESEGRIAIKTQSELARIMREYHAGELFSVDNLPDHDHESFLRERGRHFCAGYIDRFESKREVKSPSDASWWMRKNLERDLYAIALKMWNDS